MSGVSYDGYTFSTCSTYTSPSARIADTHSTVTVQLTTTPRPAELSAQKVFTLSNSNYPFLRPLVTSTVVTGYSGSLSNISTSGYSGTSTKVSTSDTKADMSVSMSETMSWTATKTFTRTRQSTSGYSGVSSSSSSISTTKETIFNSTYSKTTIPTTDVYTNAIGYSNYTESSCIESGPTPQKLYYSTSASSLSTAISVPVGYLTNGQSTIIGGASVKYYGVTNGAGTIGLVDYSMLVTDPKLPSIQAIYVGMSSFYPMGFTLQNATSSSAVLHGCNVYISKSTNRLTISVHRASSVVTWGTSGALTVAARTTTKATAVKLANANPSGTPLYATYLQSQSTRSWADNRVAFGWGFAIINLVSYPRIAYLWNSVQADSEGFYVRYTSSASKVTHSQVVSSYEGNTTSTRYTNVARNSTILDFWNSETFSNSVSQTYYSSVYVGVHHYLSSTTALTRSSDYGASSSNTASRSTSATKSWNDLNSTYTSASATNQYDVSTISTNLASLWSTIPQFTSTAFADVTAQGAMTTTARHLAGAMSRSYTFDYKTRQSSYQSSETNSNGAYTGIMSSTTALTRASYYETTSSTIGALSSTTSLYTTSGV